MSVIPNSQMSKEIRTMADFANSAYKKTKVERLNSVSKNANEWVLDDMSSAYTAIWVSESQKKVIIANRGTDMKAVKDLYADIYIALGTNATFRNTNRFKIAQAAYDAVKSNYPNYTIELSGHSLGGTINNSIYSKNKNSIQKFYNYNEGAGLTSGLENLFSTIFGKGNRKAYQNYITGDLISVLSIDRSEPNTKVFTKAPGVSFAHSLENFISAKETPKNYQ